MSEGCLRGQVLFGWCVVVSGCCLGMTGGVWVVSGGCLGGVWGVSGECLGASGGVLDGVWVVFKTLFPFRALCAPPLIQESRNPGLLGLIRDGNYCTYVNAGFYILPLG